MSVSRGPGLSYKAGVSPTVSVTSTAGVTDSGSDVAPVFLGPLQDQSNPVGSVVAVDMTVYFVGDNLIYSASNLPLTLTLDSITGQLQGTLFPEDTYLGITFTATNSSGFAQSNPIVWQVTAPIFNRYPNDELAGGASSGPGFNFPPTNHTWSFLTLNADPVDIGGGFFDWDINLAKVSGRAFLQVPMKNYLAPIVGDIVTIYVDVTNNSAFPYTVAVGSSGVSGVTVTGSRTNASAAATTTCFIRFSIDDAGWLFNWRMGVGTTANSTISLTLSNPTVYFGSDVPPFVWNP